MKECVITGKQMLQEIARLEREIERLTSENEHLAADSLAWHSQQQKLQARVDALEGQNTTIRSVLQIIKPEALIAIDAATEQEGES